MPSLLDDREDYVKVSIFMSEPSVVVHFMMVNEALPYKIENKT